MDCIQCSKLYTIIQVFYYTVIQLLLIIVFIQDKKNVRLFGNKFVPLYPHQSTISYTIILTYYMPINYVYQRSSIRGLYIMHYFSHTYIPRIFTNKNVCLLDICHTSVQNTLHSYCKIDPYFYTIRKIQSNH